MRYFVLLANIFCQRDWDRFGCEFFAERGYEVIPVEFVDYLRPGKKSEMENDSFSSLNNKVTISSLEDFENLARDFKQSDLILNNFFLDDETAPLFWVLKKFDVRYATMYANPIPTGWYKGGPKDDWAQYFKLKKEDLFSILSRLKKTLRMMMSKKLKWGQIQPPTWWIRAGHHHSYWGETFPKLWSADVVKVNSFDVEIYRHQQENKQIERPEKDKYIVIVDDGFLDPDHPDFQYAGRQLPVSSEQYLKEVRNFIVELNQKFNHKVVILLHPKSSDVHARQYLGDVCQIKYGETALYIKHSEFVVLHCTTAVSFAVLWEKPVYFYTTDELEQNAYYRDFIARMASWLGTSRKNISNIDKISIPEVNKAAYREYKEAFLCEADARPQSIWKTVADKFEASFKS